MLSLSSSHAQNPSTSCLVESTCYSQVPRITNPPSTPISHLESTLMPAQKPTIMSASQTPFPSPACRACPPSLPRLSASQGGKVHDQAPANTWDSREPLRWAQEPCFPTVRCGLIDGIAPGVHAVVLRNEKIPTSDAWDDSGLTVALMKRRGEYQWLVTLAIYPPNLPTWSSTTCD